jgi:lipoate synthase
VSVVPDGRRLLRVEARNAETPIERKPSWIRTTAKMGPEYTALHSMVKSEGLHTVCQEAGCPNIFECWEDKEATFLIGGDVCTRRCDFCDIATGRPTSLDLDEPRRVAESVARMGLRYSTVTGVARDDQPDGAAGLYAETIRQIHLLNPNTGVEILPPDFGAKPELVGQVFDARPEEFVHWSQLAEEIGFKGVMAGPLVRSSYRAGRLWATAMMKWGREIPEHLQHLAAAAGDPARQEAASLIAARQPGALGQPAPRPVS